MKKDSWLYSDSFLKRAFAIWGHAAVAHLIIMIPFFILWIIVMGMIFSAVIGNLDDIERRMPPVTEEQP